MSFRDILGDYFDANGIGMKKLPDTAAITKIINKLKLDYLKTGVKNGGNNRGYVLLPDCPFGIEDEGGVILNISEAVTKLNKLNGCDLVIRPKRIRRVMIRTYQ